jgi:N-acetylglucosaminyldiphosphoundecaprenol N-acetyl-beta-D-mannosaminyltransferase
LSKEEDESIIEEINRANPDILWVGLGSPKQDYWMFEHRARLKVPVMIGVGAAFDFLSGVKKQEPRWMQRSGLEWSFRLCSEPKRLWKRYLIGNSKFIYYLLKDCLQEFFGKSHRTSDK